MNILDQLSTLKQIPGVVNNIISNYGSMFRPLLKINSKKRILMRTNLPFFSTFIVDNQTDYMFGLEEHSSYVHIFNPLGELVDKYLLPHVVVHQLCIKGDTLYALHQKKKANCVSVHNQMKNDCKFQHRGTFNCDEHHVEDICINSNGTHLVALWFGGLSLYDVKTGLLVKKIHLPFNTTRFENIMTISVTNVVFVSNFSGNNIIRVPIYNNTALKTIGSQVLCVPTNIVISPNNEIYVCHKHAWDELVIFSNTGEVLNCVRMTQSHMQFRSNGTLVTYNVTDGIQVFT